MILGVIQPSYIPWRGYFDIIRRSDLFVFYDDVQYDKNGWRNRNRIKTSQGTVWLTVPVQSSGALTQGRLIKDVRVDSRSRWNAKHWRSIQQAYSKAPHFEWVAEKLKPIYEKEFEFLVDVDIALTATCCDLLGIRTEGRFRRSSEFHCEGIKLDRLLSLIHQTGADHYLSGPSARAYINDERFREAGVQLEYMEYRYMEYPQLYPPFDGAVSIIDLLCMHGQGATEWLNAPVCVGT